MSPEVSLRSLAPIAALVLLAAAGPAQAQPLPWAASSMGLLQAELTARFGLGQRIRIQRGLAQTARFWQAGDGGAGTFESFVRVQFAGSPAALDALFNRLEPALAAQGEHLADLRERFGEPGAPGWQPRLPVDPLLAGAAPGAHLAEDGFEGKLAFVILLNFPLTSLEERGVNGEGWTGRQWAEAWLAAPFARRTPAAAVRALARTRAAAAFELAGQRIALDHVLAGRRRLFPAGSEACAELPAAIRRQYAAGPAGLQRQRVLQQVLERLASQTVPPAVFDRPGADWDPGRPDPVADTRYARLLDLFRAARGLDPSSPAEPTHLARSFREGRQLPEVRVRAMLEAVAGSPLVARTAGLISRRLGRRLEPFDLWYPGFRPESAAGLEARVRQRWPDAAGYRQAWPGLLRQLAFAPATLAWLAGEGPGARTGPLDAHGYRQALRADGRWLAQQLARHGAEDPLVAGVPGPAFTEALARVFQARDLELLGRTPAAGDAAGAVLDTFWNLYRSAGPALLDSAVWRWLYEHPDAGPEDLRTGVLGLARELWNRLYAPVLGQKDCLLLAADSRLVTGLLSLPDEPLSRLIAFQIQQQLLRTGGFGAEFERLACLGRLTPDLWMVRATGAPLGPEALLAAVPGALERLSR